MRTREQIITSMCYTYRHDYGIDKGIREFAGNITLSHHLSSGMYQEERESLWNTMAQIFDNDIAPYMEMKDNI
jgi:CRISPR/Cas system type I-B associated protein Csh2 (Cas7 group RAMP superfamily)